MRDKTYDDPYMKSSTVMPLLVRMDTLKLLRPSDVFKDYELKSLENYARVVKPGETVVGNPARPL